jgi:hypothetical protein
MPLSFAYIAALFFFFVLFFITIFFFAPSFSLHHPDPNRLDG